MSPPPPWAAAWASVIGSSHVRRELPNQDAVRAVPFGAGSWVAAVADGHGGARYVRSDVGAAICVEVACEVAPAVVEVLGPTAAPAAIESALVGQLVARVVEEWTGRVRQHRSAHPFSDEERRRAGTDPDHDVLVSYGCTLVLTVATPGWVGLVQIGDGDATVVSPSSVDSPVPGDDRLVGGETTSLCLPTARQDARVAVVTDPLVDLVVLSSDGYANSFAGSDWRDQAGRDLHRQVFRDGLDRVGERLPEWLAASAEAGGDDVTMVLVARGAPGAPPATTPPSPTTATSGPGPDVTPTPGSAPRSRSDRAPGRTVALGTVALIAGAAMALGAAGGWFVGDRSSGTTTVPTTTPTTSIASTTSSSTTTTPTVPEGTGTTDELEDLTLIGPELVVGIRALTSQPASSEPVLLWERVTTTASIPASALPPNWQLDGGRLRSSRSALPLRNVLAVATVGDRVWAVRREGADGRVLTAFDAATGRRLGESPVGVMGPTQGSGDGSTGSSGG